MRLSKALFYSGCLALLGACGGGGGGGSGTGSSGGTSNITSVSVA